MTVAFDVGPLRKDPAGLGVYVRSLAQGLAAIGRSDLTYIGRRADAEGLPEGVPSIARGGIPYPLWVELQGDRSARSAGAAIAHFTDGLVPLVRTRPTAVTVLDLSLVRQWRSHRVVRYARIPFILAAPRLANRVIAISRATADEVVKLTNTSARRIDVVPLAARASARPVAEPELQAGLREFGLARGGYILVPGTIEPRKNHLRIVSAFEQLAREGSVARDMELVLAGGRGWKSDRALAAIDASPVRSRIKWLGYVTEQQMAVLMTGSAAVVYASTYEGFGMPVLEAMACGSVVVTSNVSSMPEVAGDAGVLIDPLDVAEIAGGIHTALAADPGARQRSLDRAATFTWEATAARTAAVYDALG